MSARAQNFSRPVVKALRTFHRWLALVLALFMLVIGVTGALLQTSIAIYGEAKHGQGAKPAPGIPFHDLLYVVHTGGFMHTPGNFYSLICGLGLIYFSLSGLWMYLDLRNARVALGKRQVFWASRAGTDAIWRTVHRWLTIVLVLFMLLVAGTGVKLNFDYLGAHTWAAGPPPTDGHGNPVTPRGPPGGPWHDTFDDIHRLDFLGAAGHWIGILAGAGVILFVVSGIYMYVAMYLRRSTLGRRKLFW